MEGVKTLTTNEEVLQLHHKEDMVDSLMADVNNTMLQQWAETSLLVGLHQVCAQIRTQPIPQYRLTDNSQAKTSRWSP